MKFSQAATLRNVVLPILLLTLPASTLRADEPTTPVASKNLSTTADATSAQAQNSPALSRLEVWLKTHPLTDDGLQQLQQQEFASAALTSIEAELAAEKIWNARRAALRDAFAAEFESREIRIGGLVMPFWFKVFGDKPATGRSLFLSLHGGGGAPARVNDGQYENQKRLYTPKEGVYLVPRAPTNTWNLWHQKHIDVFFDRLISMMIVMNDVNPDRVYLMGYSAGGDGVYQLAPRMADRFAAAAMMAGHPNETKPAGLRNLPFTIHVGEKDSAYRRNAIAAEWKLLLGRLHQQDPHGYIHQVQIHVGRGHWMNLEDAVAVPWMAQYSRRTWPDRIVWLQDDVTHTRFYWLQLNAADTAARERIEATCRGNTIQIIQADVPGLQVLLHDQLLDMNEPVTVHFGERIVFDKLVPRTMAVMAASLADRSDPSMMASGKIVLDLKGKPKQAPDRKTSQSDRPTR